MVVGSDFAPVLRKEFLDIQATIERRFTLKRIRDMIRTYSQLHRTGKYSQHSSIISGVWLNGWVFVYELSGSGFESRGSDLKICFELFLLFLWMLYQSPCLTRSQSACLTRCFLSPPVWQLSPIFLWYILPIENPGWYHPFLSFSYVFFFSVNYFYRQ